MDTAPIATDARTARIRELNDELRVFGRGGEIYLTQGMCAKGDDFVARAFRTVADFDAFTEGNDPHGEHDFGQVTVEGEGVFFKVDYYDRRKEYGADDPADPATTTRVMTILLPEEY
jgi:hypothetical protein